MPPSPHCIIQRPLTTSSHMAAAAAVVTDIAGDSIQDDEFDDYNPHPYLGGYDIALTYGQPLPPSAAICYPLSASPLPPPLQLPPPPVESRPEPYYSDPATSPLPLPPPSQLPDYSGNDADRGDSRPEPYYPDPAGSWPFWTPVEEEISRRRDCTEEPGFWTDWRRAADYLFGYSQGYGERWTRTDSYGVPIYANKKHGEQPLVVQVEPAREYKCEQLQLAPYQTSERSDEIDYYGMTLCVQENPIEEPWCLERSYGEVYGEQVDYPLHNWGSLSYDERADNRQLYPMPEYAYDRHYPQESLYVQLQPMDLTSTQKMSYDGDYREYTSADANAYSASYGEPLEPFEPTWSRNPGYYCGYEEEAFPEFKWPFSLHSEQQYDSHVFESPSHSYEMHYPEQALSVQLEPFKPTWSENPTYYEVYKDEVSPKLHQVDDPYKEIATQFFCPFQKYSDYE